MQSRFLAAACAALLASGCAALTPDAERPEIQQGNLLSPEDIQRLEKGLTRAQVRERVGEPILGTMWRANRWDYVYYSGEAGRDPGERQRLTLYFDETDRVAEIENRYQPPEDPLEATEIEAVPTVETGGELPVRDDRQGGTRTGPTSP